MKRDNSTFPFKRALRTKALAWIDSPVVMETHGGYGKLFDACYAHVERGIVFEKDERKADFLAEQRPTWAVYQADCVNALSEGAGAHLLVNVLDLDPYGEPWPVLDAWFASDRPRAAHLLVVVNDGLRQKIRLGGAWSVHSLADAVRQFGNNLHGVYLEVARYLMESKAAQAGYTLDRFVGYYCGFQDQMTHYAGLLVQGGGDA